MILVVYIFVLCFLGVILPVVGFGIEFQYVFTAWVAWYLIPVMAGLYKWRFDALRKSKLWRKIFPKVVLTGPGAVEFSKMIKEAEDDPEIERPGLIAAIHPCGISNTSILSHFIFTESYEYVIGVTNSLYFYIPIIREICWWVGAIPPYRKQMKQALVRDQYDLVVSPGVTHEVGSDGEIVKKFGILTIAAEIDNCTVFPMYATSDNRIFVAKSLQVKTLDDVEEAYDIFCGKIEKLKVLFKEENKKK